jgi:hypothetical protein
MAGSLCRLIASNQMSRRLRTDAAGAEDGYQDLLRRVDRA